MPSSRVRRLLKKKLAMTDTDGAETRKHLRVVIASPGDVQRERDSLAEIIELLNRGMADERGYYLRLYRWETDVYPRFHAEGPQAAIDAALRIEESDIIIGVFWARFGTPVKDANSGTEHELRIAYEAWRRSGKRPLIMLYFNTRASAPKTVEAAEQLKQVLEFKKTIAREAIYSHYKGLDDFKRTVTKDLTHIVRQLSPYNPSLNEAVKAPRPDPPLEPLSPYAWDNMPLRSAHLYTFGGLRRETRNDSLIQDFKIDRQRYINPNPVSYIWADVYRGGWINASVEESDPPHLSVAFENKPSSWPCNIAIRPIAERAVLTDGKHTLCIEARLAAERFDAGTLAEVFIATRIINGWYQHWAYGPGTGRYRLLPITESWSTIEISLTSDDWWLFNSDGNRYYGPQQPDLSIIGSIVIEFGSDGIDRPGPGRATVLIRSVHLLG